MFKLFRRILGGSLCKSFPFHEPGTAEACRVRTSVLEIEDARSSAMLCALGDAPRIPPFLGRPVPAHIPPDAAFVSDIRLPCDLDAYLVQQGNTLEDIARCQRVLAMNHVILEIGCGGGEIAWQIASKNPHTGVIATDKYDVAGPAGEGSFYRKMARDWKDGRLKVQQTIPDNLAVLRAEAELIRYLPCRRIDTVLLVNPEPAVGEAFVSAVEKEGWLELLKPGKRKIVIKPYSREMNVMSCGGYEFDHSEDWSCGLGFILGSALPFKEAGPVNWSVDLSSASPYGRNSTQHRVYVCGD